MLFLQGTRDALGGTRPAQAAVRRRSASARCWSLFQDADHSFHVPARTGRRDPQVRSEMLDALAEWIDAVDIAARCRVQYARL